MYSEIKACVPSGYIGQHLLTHIRGYVDFDETPRATWIRGAPLRVIDGILVKMPQKSRKYRRPKETYPEIKIDESSSYIMIDGLWFHVEFSKITEGFCFDVITRELCGITARRNSTGYSHHYVWGHPVFPRRLVYASSKRQIGGKELKRVRKLEKK